MVPATYLHLMSLVPFLRARDRFELEGTHGGNCGSWAFTMSRAEVAYACVTDGWCVQFVAGVLRSRMGVATLWFAARDGWQRYAKHLMRLWKTGRKHLRYRRIEALIYADNATARAFAEKLGFAYEGTLRALTLRGDDVAIYSITEA